MLIVPSFFFTRSIIEARKPLGPTAKRAGWQGCNLRLDYVAPDGKRKLIDSATVAPIDEIRAWYSRVKPLQEIPVTARGWTLDVLNIVQHLSSEFTLADVYAHEAALSLLHPDNRFMERGRYRRR